MRHTDLYEILADSLPVAPDRYLLKNFISSSYPELPDQTALIKAIEDYTIIDWDKYLTAYPDVLKAKMDPLLHFFLYGSREKRKLEYNAEFVNTYLTVAPKKPAISIVVPNYNNAIYLKKAITSLLNQTLENIEIVIVDDCSTDNSIEIIEKFMRKDSRIKLYKLAKNSSQHMARKEGVKNASGEYIMFMDPDDYLTSDACEILYNKIYNAYDMVCFCMHVIFAGRFSAAFKNKYVKYLNSGPEASYYNHEILPAIYESRKINELLCNKIYVAGLCKNAFKDMDDGYMTCGEDVYEAYVLASRAASAAKINNAIYVRIKGEGISTARTTEASQRAFMTAGDAHACLRRYLEKTGNIKYLTSVFGHISHSVNSWIDKCPPDSVTYNFNRIIDQYGIMTILRHFLEYHQYNWVKIANKFANYADGISQNKKIRSVGILYNYMPGGGAERVIWEMAPALYRKGYKVTIFLEKNHINDAKFPREINVVYLGAYGNNKEYTLSALNGLMLSLTRNPVDVMLCHACFDGSLLWSIILLKLLKIGVLLFSHNSFCHRLIYNGRYTIEAAAAIFRCADKVCVLSRNEELYFKNLQVNAQYIPNPVKFPPNIELSPQKYLSAKYNISICSRLGDPTKNLIDSLRILKIIKEYIPHIKMTFIGSFLNDSGKKEFYEQAHNLGVLSNIHVTGWLEDPSEYLQASDVLLSTSWLEAFPLAISEAQGLGIPVVMYEVPIELASNNPSIIQVSHGDLEGAAKAIMLLIENPNIRYNLGKIARERILEFFS